uniref:HTH CENPB-type domain-containing protein n=1 Tax=Strongyloides venezuelensis TaxID=75913 RepID=A0A0K0FQP3_STRVS
MEKIQWRGFRQVSIAHDIRKKEKISRKLSDPVKLGNGKQETTNKLLLELMRKTPTINRKNSFDIIKMKIESVDKSDIKDGINNEKNLKQLTSIELFECLQNNMIDEHVIYTLTKRTTSPRQLSQVLQTAARIYEKDRIKKLSLITANWLSKFETLDFLLTTRNSVVSHQVIPRRCLSENALDVLLKSNAVVKKRLRKNLNSETTPRSISPTEVKVFFETNNNLNNSCSGVDCFKGKKRVSFSAPTGPPSLSNGLGDSRIKMVRPIVKKEIQPNSEYPLCHMDYESFKAWRRGSKMSNETLKDSELSSSKLKDIERYIKKKLPFNCSRIVKKDKRNVTESGIGNNSQKLYSNDRRKSGVSNLKKLFCLSFTNCFRTNINTV